MDMPSSLSPFTVKSVPEIHFGAGRVAGVGADAARLGDAGKPIVLIVDAALEALGTAGRVSALLAATGAEVAQFADLADEPKESQLDAATEFVRARDPGLVVSLGGGSAMDVGKVAAAVAPSGKPPGVFAMDGLTVPKRTIPSLCIPTTAGTGSEVSSTNIFTGKGGRKLWVWSAETKPDAVILDAELTTTLAPDLTAWTGLDAFAHALESSTNTHRHPGGALYAHGAMGLIAHALETAVSEPANLKARGRMLLASCWAGTALDNCSAGLAHNISHALAALAPVHHGLATGLALEAILAWQVETDDGAFAEAAEACGLDADGGALVPWYADLLSRCGVERRLPPGFENLGAAALAAEMRAPETEPMRRASLRPVTEADIERFAGAVMGLA